MGQRQRTQLSAVRRLPAEAAGGNLATCGGAFAAGGLGVSLCGSLEALPNPPRRLWPGVPQAPRPRLPAVGE